MEVTGDRVVHVAETSQIGAARRLAISLAEAQGFNEADVGRVGIAVSEAAANLVKHAGGGDVVVGTIVDSGVRGIEFVAVDRGPGIVNLTQALDDGYSTAGSSGTGLGAIRRQSQLFDIYSTSGLGTVVLGRFFADGAEPSADGMIVGGLAVPVSGEDVCGDAWDVVQRDARTAILVADGLGHGVGAAEASARAVDTFRARLGEPPARVLEWMHEALRPTRGAAVAIADVDRGRGLVHYAGIGNIAATILVDGTMRSLVSHHGTLGHDARKFREFQYPWPNGGLLVMHSDGLVSHWTLERYPGLAMRHPTTVASVLYRDCARGRDDTTVVVAREATR